MIDNLEYIGTMRADSTPRASLGNDEADHAGSCLFYPKNPLSVEELANHLIDKGLLVTEEGRDHLLSALQQWGYYRLRGYWLTLEDNGRFLPQTSIDDILELEEFDRALSQFLFRCIAPVEIKLRAQLSGTLAETYGPRALHDSSLFKVKEDYVRLQYALEREIKQSVGAKRPLVLHHLGKYGELPIWAEVEISSLGTLSRIYENLADFEVAARVARSFGVPRAHLKNWLRYLNQIRNVCAHHDRLYNKLFSIRPRLFSEHRGLDTARLFPVFLVVFKLLESIDPQKAYAARVELDGIIREYPQVNLKPCGFPSDWRSILGIQQILEPKTGRPRGRKGGRPAKNAAAIQEALYLYDTKAGTIAQIAERTGVSSSTLYKYLSVRKDNAGSEDEPPQVAYGLLTVPSQK